MVAKRWLALLAAFFLVLGGAAGAERPHQVLLLGARRDHPKGRHHYMAGMRVLARCLEGLPNLKVQVVAADEPWPEGPDLLRKADAVVLYLGEGARWFQANPQRQAAFQDLARRGGGIVALHWAVGAKDARYVELCRAVLGGCHGGPDRKYIVQECDLRVAGKDHPVARGLSDLRIKDEFYYRLKFARQGTLHPLLQASIEGNWETVGWAYDRPDGGRSVGFGGLDAHETWRQVTYRRLAAQAVLWTLKLPIPEGGLPVKVSEKDFLVPADE